jgi:hypothetical protein
MARPINYLNNRDLMKEIHKSKTSYCSFTDSKYSDYDMIVSGLHEMQKLLDSGEAVTIRRDRLAKLAVEIYASQGVKVFAEDVDVPEDMIKPSDVIFRFKTWDHIPEAVIVPKVIKGKKKSISSIIESIDPLESIVTEYDLPIPEVVAPSKKYVKVNFQPFQHWKLDENTNNLICVGKSHWQGDLELGSFNKMHGQISRELAQMFMKLTDRYASRYNWRSYTYVDEMKSTSLLQLSQVGLQFDESVSANPFSYLTMILQNSFTRVLNIEKKNQNIRDDILQMNDLAPSFSRQNSDDYHVAGHDE